MTTQGRLIAVEGLDGSGKTTFSRALAERLAARWTTTPDLALRAVRDEVERVWESSAHARRLFYAASVVACSDQCRPWLEAGETVVVDRYWSSTLAYAALEGSCTALDEVGRLVRPADVTFYLEISDELRRARLSQRGATTLDRASLAHEKTLREGYRRALSGHDVGRVLVLDASASLDAMVTLAVDLLSDAARARAITTFGQHELTFRKTR